jgi:hypothetical protein
MVPLHIPGKPTAKVKGVVTLNGQMLRQVDRLD